jgi:hypothetical protein
MQWQSCSGSEMVIVDGEALRSGHQRVVSFRLNIKHGGSMRAAKEATLQCAKASLAILEARCVEICRQPDGQIGTESRRRVHLWKTGLLTWGSSGMPALFKLEPASQA